MAARVHRLTAAMSAAFVLAACTNGGTSFNPPVYVANVAATSKLQLAVGTATIATSADPLNPAPFYGINFVTTFRGVDGQNATTSNTPTLTGPPGFSFGPLLGNTNSVSGRTVPQMQTELTAILAGTMVPVEDYQNLGPLVGVFGYGFAQDNLVSNQLISQIVTKGNFAQNACLGIGVVPSTPTNDIHSTELKLPVLQGDNTSNVTCPNSSNALNITSSALPMAYYGGPPSWPSTIGYGSPDFFSKNNAPFANGYPAGFTDFALAPVAGTYTLDVAYPTAADFSSLGHVSTTAKLQSTAALLPIAQPTFTRAGDGSGIVFVNVPSGVSETIVFATASVCDPAQALLHQFVSYAVVEHGTGLVAFPFASNLGPPDASGKPTHTFCVLGDFPPSATAPGNPIGQVTIAAVGFDYPAFEASYPLNVSQTPTLANAANGQADVTTSFPFVAPLDIQPLMSLHRKKI